MKLENCEAAYKIYKRLSYLREQARMLRDFPAEVIVRFHFPDGETIDELRFEGEAVRKTLIQWADNIESQKIEKLENEFYKLDKE